MLCKKYVWATFETTKNLQVIAQDVVVDKEGVVITTD